MYWSLQALAAATGQAENVRLARAPLVMLCIPPQEYFDKAGPFYYPQEMVGRKGGRIARRNSCGYIGVPYPRRPTQLILSPPETYPRPPSRWILISSI
jgi:hypothetical protein